MTATKKKTRRRSTSTTPNAIRLLTQDHRDVKNLFQEYQELMDHEAPESERLDLAREICAALRVHAQIEEEIFYPAAAEVLKEPALVDEAMVEHASAKDLIAQIETSLPGSGRFDAKVKVLGEYIDHHAKEEEGQMFPRLRKARLDLESIGNQLQERKTALTQDVDSDEDAAPAPSRKK